MSAQIAELERQLTRARIDCANAERAAREYARNLTLSRQIVNQLEGQLKEARAKEPREQATELPWELVIEEEIEEK